MALIVAVILAVRPLHGGSQGRPSLPEGRMAPQNFVVGGGPLSTIADDFSSSTSLSYVSENVEVEVLRVNLYIFLSKSVACRLRCGLAGDSTHAANKESTVAETIIDGLA